MNLVWIAGEPSTCRYFLSLCGTEWYCFKDCGYSEIRLMSILSHIDGRPYESDASDKGLLIETSNAYGISQY
jgi:hypothetical protein